MNPEPPTIPADTETIRVWAGGKSRAKYPMLLLVRWRGYDRETGARPLDGWWSRQTGNGYNGGGHLSDDYVETLVLKHRENGARVECSPIAEPGS